MSSVKEEKEDLKGGHLPAGACIFVNLKSWQKYVGGDPRDLQGFSIADWAIMNKLFELEENRNPNDERRLIISGVPVRGNKDFPPEAVKSFHEKPMPPVQQRHAPASRVLNIQQPRK